VREESEPRLASGQDGREAVKLCLAAEKSLSSGETVEVMKTIKAQKGDSSGEV